MATRVFQVQRNGFLAYVGRNEIAVAVIVDNPGADIAIWVARQPIARRRCLDPDDTPPELGKAQCRIRH